MGGGVHTFVIFRRMNKKRGLFGGNAEVVAPLPTRNCFPGRKIGFSFPIRPRLVTM